MDRYSDIYGNPIHANFAQRLAHAPDIKAAFVATGILGMAQISAHPHANRLSTFGFLAILNASVLLKTRMLEWLIVTSDYRRAMPPDETMVLPEDMSFRELGRFSKSLLRGSWRQTTAISRKAVDHAPAYAVARNSMAKYHAAATSAKNWTAATATIMALMPVYAACRTHDPKALVAAMFVAAPVLRFAAAYQRHKHIAEGDWAIVDMPDRQEQKVKAPAGLHMPDPTPA